MNKEKWSNGVLEYWNIGVLEWRKAHYSIIPLLHHSIALIICLVLSTSVEGSRIKDIARIKGMEEHQLIGYGLVVGLQGTGDSRRSPFTQKSIRNLVEEIGELTADGRRTYARNIASVIVTAKLPTLKKRGTTIDVGVSSIGDAKSLAEGVLLPTLLKGLDGKVYASAQGVMLVGDESLTIGQVLDGAVVKRSIEITLGDTLFLIIEHPDFISTVAVKDTINHKLGTDVASIIDGSSIKIAVSEEKRGKPVEFITEIETLEVTLDRREKIIVNRVTGAIVSGLNIKLYPVKLNYKELKVEITEETTVGDFIDTIYTLGVSDADVIAILKVLKSSGAIESEVIVI